MSNTTTTTTTAAAGNDGSVASGVGLFSYEIFHAGQDDIITCDGEKSSVTDISDLKNRFGDTTSDYIKKQQQQQPHDHIRRLPIEYTHEILFHFTCPQCKRWWSYAADDSTWHSLVEKTLPQDPITCMHCGYTSCIAEKKDIIDK
jgi:hypothetical protein